MFSRSYWFSALQVIAITVVLADTTSVLYADPDQAQTEGFVGNYCGLYAWMAASKVLGQSVNPEVLLDEGVVDSPKGSSAAAILRAAENQGLSAWPFKHGSEDMLQASSPPILLLLRGRSDSGIDYHHWVTWLGPSTEQDVRWFDPDDGLRDGSISELVARWTGVGVALGRSENAPNELAIRMAGLCRPTAILATTLLGHLLLRRLMKSTALGREPTSAFTLWVLTCCLCGWIYAMVTTTGLLNDAQAARLVQTMHGSSFARLLDLGEFSRLVTEEALIIDARYPADYAEGHVPGAINVPVSWSTEQVDEWANGLTESVRQDTEVVVYCQSIGCGYDEIVAARLYSAGFRRIALFPPGWIVWKEALDAGP